MRFFQTVKRATDKNRVNVKDRRWQVSMAHFIKKKSTKSPCTARGISSRASDTFSIVASSRHRKMTLDSIYSKTADAKRRRPRSALRIVTGVSWIFKTHYVFASHIEGTSPFRRNERSVDEIRVVERFQRIRWFFDDFRISWFWTGTYVRRAFSDQSISRCATYPAGCLSCLVPARIRYWLTARLLCQRVFPNPSKAGQDHVTYNVLFLFIYFVIILRFYDNSKY